jgi:hypothetical protein
MSKRRLVVLAAGLLGLACLWAVPQAGAVAGGPISGKPQVGETLTASEALDYRWQRCDPTINPCTSSGATWFLDAGWSNIPLATSRNYTLTENDEGMMIRVVSNGIIEGVVVSVGSPPVGPVIEAEPANTTPPSISGTAREGSTLTGNDGAWTGSNLSFARQWQRSNGSGGYDNIPGATGSTYGLTASDVGHQIRLRVVATGDGGESEPAFSTAVGPVLPLVPSNTTKPSISGDAVQGETLTADDGAWQSSASFTTSRRWQRSDGSGGFDDIPGATGPTYELTVDDVGHQIRLRVVATNAGGNSAPATSDPTATVLYSKPVNVSRPTISGPALVGERLTGHDGTWDGDSLTFARQWQVLGSDGWEDIDGATGQTYVPTEADMNRRIRLRVVASNPDNVSDPAYSAPTDPVENPPVFGESGNLDPQGGIVLAQLPGSDEVRRIEELTQVPLGTKVDVTGGFVDLTTQRGPGEALQTETLWDGAFVLGQRQKGRITVLRLTDPILAGKSRTAEAQASGRRHRRLWGRGRCRCRTRGRNSSGTARGTWWLTAERRRGTFTKVKEGAVLVRDFTRNKKVLVKAGHKHLAPNH